MPTGSYQLPFGRPAAALLNTGHPYSIRARVAAMARRTPDPKFLADLVRGHRLYANCPKCKRTKLLDVDKIERRFGPFFTLDEVRQRVRCTKCRKRTQTLRLLVERR